MNLLDFECLCSQINCVRCLIHLFYFNCGTDAKQIKVPPDKPLPDHSCWSFPHYLFDQVLSWYLHRIAGGEAEYLQVFLHDWNHILVDERQALVHPHLPNGNEDPFMYLSRILALSPSWMNTTTALWSLLNFTPLKIFFSSCAAVRVQRLRTVHQPAPLGIRQNNSIFCLLANRKWNYSFRHVPWDFTNMLVNFNFLVIALFLQE